MTKVFVIILNWNQSELTAECLESVSKVRVLSYELNIVVVDNASSKPFKTHNKKCKVIRNIENFGFAGGNNVGIKYALENGADYIMILNNDTIVHPDLLHNLINSADSHGQVGAISPMIYFAKGYEFHKDRYKEKDLGRVIWYAGGKLDWENVYGSTRSVDEVDSGKFKKTEETDFATGTCMFMPASAIKKAGMFDEKYFMYYEDTDLSIRFKKFGFRVLFEPSALVWHKVAQSSGIGSNLNDYYTTRNRMLFGMKYASLRTKFALFRESIKLLLIGRKWQRIGVKDYYLGNFGRGSYES